jgi:serine/threonine protein kinase
MITDFGLARAVDDVVMTQSGCLAGTPNYMSPEQVHGSRIDHRSDLFSLGSLLYFVVTGREPFRAESAFAVINKVTREEPLTARSLNADVPEVFDRIINRLREKNPDDRFDSAAKLQQSLTEILAHLQDPTQHALPKVRATTSERRSRRKQLVLIAITGLLVSIVGGSLWLFGNRGGSNASRRTGVQENSSLGEHRVFEHHGERDAENGHDGM